MDNRQLTFSHLLYLTAHHWRLAVNRRLKNLGLSQASWVAVASIARHQQPLSQSELAQELGVESPTIVPLIHRLVALGLVERITTASVPKMVLVFGVMLMLMPYMLATLATFTQNLADRIIRLGTGP